MMPGVDGFEVCTRLKKDSATKDTEVIAITGYYTEANMDRILSAGAAACLKKPLDVMEVRRHVIDSFNLKEIGSGSDRPPATPRDETSRVLLVTQNADFRARIREELSATDPVVEVLTAQTGADALLVAQTAPPQYVILSLTVPDLAGSEGAAVIEKLASSGHGVQIIAVHDAPTDEIRQMARTAGARMCLPTNAVTGSVRELLGV
jgi:CheY-like chemotaxis protein